MKILKTFFLLFSLLTQLSGMEPGAKNSPTISLYCSVDKKTIEQIDRKVLEQSSVLASMLEDVRDSGIISVSIPVQATEDIMKILIPCMQILANHDNIAGQKFYQIARNKIRDLVMVIDISVNKCVKRKEKKDIILQLFSTAHDLNLTAVFSAIACIAARDNLFKQSEVNPDLWRKIQQAKDFLGNNLDFEDIDNSDIKDYTPGDLIGWGILPQCYDPVANIGSGSDYITHVAEKDDSLSLEGLLESLECWPKSLAEYIEEKSIPIMQIKLMMDEKFDELQKLLDCLLAKELIKQAQDAYALLADYVGGLSKDQIEELFQKYPQMVDSAFKTALDITYAKKCNNPSLPFSRFINSSVYHSSLSILLSLPTNQFPTRWNIMFSENLTTRCLSENSIPLSLFNQEKLKYLLPLLEPMFGQIVGLNLSGRNLSTIPAEICFLPNVKVLILSDNNLSDLPDTLEFLQELVYLDLNDNLFQIAPDSIFKIGKLTKLYLHNNSIYLLSTGVSLLQNLKKLYLDKSTIIAGNSITQSSLTIKLWDDVLHSWFEKQN